jgi:hypothetical protein
LLRGFADNGSPDRRHAHATPPTNRLYFKPFFFSNGSFFMVHFFN